MVDIVLAVVERSLVDNGVDEGAEVAHVAHLDFFQHAANNLLDLGPHGGGHVCAAGCRAFLALELEGATDDGGSHLVGVGTFVDHDEVLAPGLADNLRIALILVDILADGFPEPLEGGGGTCEVDTGEVLVGESHLADEGTAAGEEVDHTVGKTGLLVDFHQQVVGKHGGGRGLPDADIAHQHGAHAEVGGDGGEVEGGDGEHETLQGTVDAIVQRALVAARLVAVNLAGVVGIVAKEVAEFASAVNFCLHGGLALAQHRGSVDEPTVFAADESGDLQHDAGTVNPGCLGPFLLSLHGGGDSVLDLLLAYLVVAGEDVVILGRHDDFAHILGLDFLATDDGGNLGHLAIEFIKSLADFLTLGAAGLVTQYRFVLRLREREDCVVHNAVCFVFLFKSTSLDTVQFELQRYKYFPNQTAFLEKIPRKTIHCVINKLPLPLYHSHVFYLEPGISPDHP